MTRVALLGSDSSHTDAYAELLNGRGGGLDPDARVESLWGEDPGQAREKAEACGIPRVAGTPAEACEGADLVMVIGRYGDGHAAPAREAIEAGAPVFIDKPMTNDAAEAAELAALARERGTQLASFSPLRFAPELDALRELGDPASLRGAVVSSPADCALLEDPRAMELHFYGIHALDLLFVPFGSEVRWVSASATDKSVWATLGYADGRHAALNLMVEIGDFYNAAVIAPDGARAVDIDPAGPFYERSLAYLLGPFLRGDAARAPIEDAVRGVAVIDAILRSADEGRPVELEEIAEVAP